MKQDVTGKRFGRLVAIEKTTKKGSCGSYLWKCKCDCGNETLTRIADLKSGHKSSCGCYRIERSIEAKKLKISGKKFEKVTVLEETNERKRSDGKIIWKCKCDCGVIFLTNATDLIKGNTKSCGCRQREIAVPIINRIRKENLKEDTKLDMLTSKIPINNTTGVKGVYLHKNTQKYLASITFQKKKIHLGTFSTLEEAKEARQKAEEEYFKPMLEKYNKPFEVSK